jgi:hypothetical protein
VHTHLPKYEFTAKDVTTSLTFVALAYEKSIINAARFIFLVLSHLKRFGVDLSSTVIQTDWGTEFLGPTNSKEPSLFVKVIEETFKATHTTIPVATPRFNGVVENFNGCIEDEFYQIEPITQRLEMQERLYGYMLYYHMERPNQGLDYKTPFQFLKEKTTISDANIVNFPPLIIDEIPLYVDQPLNPKTGDFFPDLVNFSQKAKKVESLEWGV